MKNRLNLVSALCYQAVTIISGLLVPRMILSSMGSEINGLISSLNQYLGIITLLEGGLGAVVLSELYEPIEKKDYRQLKGVLSAGTSYFQKLAVYFVVYTLILSVIYPVIIYKNKTVLFTGSLILIVSVSTILQYLFCITNKLLLQADQKIYIVNFLSTAMTLLNLLLTVIILKIYPNIHILKLISAVAYIIQPVFYKLYIDKYYKELRNIKKSSYKLKNRWSAFSQNLAHFVNMNTDILLITFFEGVNEVSVYSVYMLALNALRNLILTGANSFQGALGKSLAIGNKVNTNVIFRKFEKTIWMVSIVCFGTSLMLIIPFVKLYTQGITDTNYYRPVFACIMVVAQFVFSARESYRLLILAAGKFKETNFGSYMEAIINLMVSFVLIQKWGIEGVAIGTLLAGVYRLLYFVYYLNKDIVYIRYSQVVPYIIISSIVFVGSIIWGNKIHITSFVDFICWGVLSVFSIGGIVVVLCTVSEKLRNIVNKEKA